MLASAASRAGAAAGARALLASSARAMSSIPLGEARTSEELERRYLMPTYSSNGVRIREGLTFAKGSGSYLIDTEGKRYLDFGAGIAVNALGHSDEAWARVVASQALTLAHSSNLVHTAPPLQLAKRLVELSCFDKAFFCNSGTEANEAALKFARRWALAQDGLTRWTALARPRPRVVAFHGGFHGRTMGSLSVTHKPAIRHQFAPLVPDVTFAKLNDIEDVARAMGPDVAAVIVEPIQGEGGVIPADAGFLRDLRQITTENNALLIADEVQCGMGRAGTLWAHEAAGVEPDMMTLAKPLANGLPIGAVLVKDFVAAAIKPGDHGGTFGGNPLATAVGLHVLERIADPAFLADVRDKGAHMLNLLSQWTTSSTHTVKQLRRPPTDALWAGLELHGPVAGVVQAALDKGVLFITAGPNTVRLSPPLTISKDEISHGMGVLKECVIGGAGAKL
ncbi:hypothetical protein FNF28_07542 [Cafeteria roenbergensis]|uniref:acetylornithine transaminase n=1 Tax=Cafeteria roenbergensis TaxID=33653 RepID=A0A5A8C6D5_CAFRO|nr:hypothetical protein FNF28_07542 [Cafeteria roenbergensis]